MTLTDTASAPKPPMALQNTLGPNAVRDIATTLTALLADAFALYIKTKNFHWHMSGPHFRDYHLMLDEQADEVFAMTDAIAERVRKLGGTTLRSIGHIARLQRIRDNDAGFVRSDQMLSELEADTAQFLEYLRSAHAVCDEHGDVASASLIENWIDEAERRRWFLFETIRPFDGASTKTALGEQPGGPQP